eukprot:TRINITY_DN64487_c1_g1_i2.p2 TRINITY_DN64487_c1_g1~~TRINITY_DN64487_c1_g1_i2.p2  ORF type:complete len:219 (-),score=20.30 TRINITY_DN64487_c1_g1_i2:1839-2495(-)
MDLRNSYQSGAEISHSEDDGSNTTGTTSWSALPLVLASHPVHWIARTAASSSLMPMCLKTPIAYTCRMVVEKLSDAKGTVTQSPSGLMLGYTALSLYLCWVCFVGSMYGVWKVMTALFVPKDGAQASYAAAMLMSSGAPGYAAAEVEMIEQSLKREMEHRQEQEQEQNERRTMDDIDDQEELLAELQLCDDVFATLTGQQSLAPLTSVTTHHDYTPIE